MDSTLNPPLHDHGQDESKHRGGSPVLYKECVRNINAENGGEEVHDGCQKFTAAGKDGSPEALKCGACGCHRNFHQQESETPTAIKGSDLTQFADDILGVVKKTKRKNTHRAINLATQVLEHVSKLLNILAQVIDDPDDTLAKRRWLLLWRRPRTKLRVRMIALQRRSERGPSSAPSSSPSSKLWPRVCTGLWETYPRINRRVLPWRSG